MPWFKLLLQFASFGNFLWVYPWFHLFGCRRDSLFSYQYTNDKLVCRRCAEKKSREETSGCPLYICLLGIRKLSRWSLFLGHRSRKQSQEDAYTRTHTQTHAILLQNCSCRQNKLESLQEQKSQFHRGRRTKHLFTCSDFGKFPKIELADTWLGDATRPNKSGLQPKARVIYGTLCPPGGKLSKRKE